MNTSDYDRCAACGSVAPQWIEADDFDGPEDYDRACLNWEEAHTGCTGADQAAWREETYDPDEPYQSEGE